jgi:hypothetical protein
LRSASNAPAPRQLAANTSGKLVSVPVRGSSWGPTGGEVGPGVPWGPTGGEVVVVGTNRVLVGASVPGTVVLPCSPMSVVVVTASVVLVGAAVVEVGAAVVVVSPGSVVVLACSPRLVVVTGPVVVVVAAAVVVVAAAVVVVAAAVVVVAAAVVVVAAAVVVVAPGTDVVVVPPGIDVVVVVDVVVVLAVVVVVQFEEIWTEVCSVSWKLSVQVAETVSVTVPVVPKGTVEVAEVLPRLATDEV